MSDVIFKPVEGFPGYRVGDDGSLWSCLGRKGKGIGNGSGVILTTSWRRLVGGKDKDGYLKAIICANGKRRHVRINRLVLETFVGDGKGKMAAHENGNNTDNRLDNLRWDHQAGNIADKKTHGTHQEGEKHGGRVLDAAKVRSIRDRRASGESLDSIATDFGIAVSTVSAIVTRRLWKSVA